MEETGTTMDASKEFSDLLTKEIGNAIDKEILNQMVSVNTMSTNTGAELQYDPNSNSISWNSIPNASLITNANWNNSWATGTYIRDSEEYAAPQRYELKDVNGNKFIIDMTDQKVEKIKELSYRTSKFSKKFPFVKFEKKKYTKITVSKKMGDKESFMIKVDCNLSVLMKLLGLEYNSWAKGVMSECVKRGSIQN